MTGLSIQDGTWVNQTIGGHPSTALSIMDMDMGGMTNSAIQNKDMFAAKQFVQVTKFRNQFFSNNNPYRIEC